MRAPAAFRPVQRWRSELGPRVCPYQNPFAPARWFFSLRLREAIRAVGPPASGRALEIGCWEGFFLPTLLLNYARVAAVDNDSASLVERTPARWTILQAARDLCVREIGDSCRLFVLKADAVELPFRNGSFHAAFCLDTLPFVMPHKRGILVAEMRRVLRPGSPVIFALPIELGAGLLLREVLRKLSGTWRDGYTWREIRQALFGKPAAIAERSGPTNLIEYDYRRDERLIRSEFVLRQRKFLPCNTFRWISPTILLSCTVPKGR